MVLLTMLQQLGPTAPQIVVAHVNHELRAQSAEEEAFLKDYCQRRGLTCVVRHWPRSAHPSHGVEAAGRRFRYRFFAELMRRYHDPVLMTAHHANDEAETILMKLVRGGQIDAVAGLRRERSFAGGRLIRPLLHFTKAEIRTYAIQHHLRWYEDATNDDLSIQRNRFRHQILPALERENPQVVSHLIDFHEQLTALLQFRDQELHRLLKICSSGDELQLDSYLKFNSVTQRLVLRSWLEAHGIVNLKGQLLNELVALLANSHRPQARFSLPHGWQVEKSYRQATLLAPEKPQKRPQQREVAVVKLGQWFSTRKGAIAIQSAFQPTKGIHLVARMWLRLDQMPLTLRQCRPGDQLRLRSGHHQRVRRILIDQHVPADQRSHQLVLADAHGAILWVVGRKTAWYDYPTNPQRGGHDYYLVRRSNKREDQRQDE